jgi:hypothetical protein
MYHFSRLYAYLNAPPLDFWLSYGFSFSFSFFSPQNWDSVLVLGFSFKFKKNKINLVVVLDPV